MKKSKGFTLIELIATVALIAFLATVILINMTGVKSNEEQSAASTYIKNVQEAACTYIDMSNQTELREQCKSNANSSACNISLRTLISDSVALIDENLLNPATNKTAKQEQDEVYVKVSWQTSNGYKEKKCEFKRK